MIPNMRRTVLNKSITVTLQTTTTTVIDYKPTKTTVDSQIRANVQPLKADEIQALEYDTTLRYLRVFSPSETELIVDDNIVFNGKTYRIVRSFDYSIYGYWECHAEEIKE